MRKTLALAAGPLVALAVLWFFSGGETREGPPVPEPGPRAPSPALAAPLTAPSLPGRTATEQDAPPPTRPPKADAPVPVPEERRQEDDAGTLVLPGPGEISGIVVFADGAPVEGAGVAVVRTDEGEMEETLAGLTEARAETDALGRFRFTGLAEGRYRLGPSRRDQFPRVTCSTGDSDLRLVVSGVRLRVRSRDEVGEPHPFVTLFFHRPSEENSINKVYVAGELTEWTSWIAPETDYIVELRCGEGHSAEAPVRVPLAQRELVLDVVFHAPPEAGWIEVVTRDPSGTLLPLADVGFREAESGALMFELSAHLRPGLAKEVPPGRYVVTIQPGGRVEGTHFLPVERSVVVRSGALERIHVVAATGGLIAAMVRVPPGTGETVKVRVELESDDGEPSKLNWRTDLRDEGFLVSDTLSPKVRSVTSRPLRPGGVLLRFLAPGFAVEERTVAVVAGETAEVEVQLVPE